MHDLKILNLKGLYLAYIEMMDYTDRNGLAAGVAAAFGVGLLGKSVVIVMPLHKYCHFHWDS